MLEKLRKASLKYKCKYEKPLLIMDAGSVVYGSKKEVLTHKIRLSRKSTKVSFDNNVASVYKKLISFDTYLNSIHFKMLLCPAGVFTMGHVAEEYNQPTSKIIEQPFLLGETEVTQELYDEVMKGTSKKSQKPASQLTWYDAVAFCNKLSALKGLDAYYTILEPKQDVNGIMQNSKVSRNIEKNGYRLPTEEEWEYAAKAGTNNRWSGTDNESELGAYAVYEKNSVVKGKKKVHSVKTKKSNEWGFYDMSGNVEEWCWDLIGNPEEQEQRMVRGGQAQSDEVQIAVSRRWFHSHYACTIGDELGFRLCRTIFS